MEEINKIEELHDLVFQHLWPMAEADKDFRFSLRKSDKGNRLSKGYFFYGNESYLALSFWSGTNWKNKTPNINLVFIPEEETSYLEIAVSDSPEKEEFVKNYILDADQEIYEENGKYYKPIFGDTYIEMLNNFISKEKKLIDQIVKEHGTFFLKKDSENRIGFIDAELFKFRLAKAHQFRKRKLSENLLTEPIFLSEVKISKFFPIENLQLLNIPNNTQWIFFTGLNGSGKSSILRALTLALCPNVTEHFDLDDTGHYEIFVQLQSGNNKINIASAPGKLQVGEYFQSRGFAAYGPSRLQVSDETTKKKIAPDDLLKRQSPSYSIFHPDGILLDFSSEIELLKKDKSVTAKDKLEIIVETLIESIDSLSNILVHRNERPYVNVWQTSEFIEKDELDQKFLSVKFSQLSSGTRSLIAMIGDMMIRLFRSQPEINDVGSLEGIVLIDEIDLHFHPSQQRNLVEALSDIFPKVQFVATTHSPIPFLGAPENSIFVHVKRTVKNGVEIERLNIDIKNLLPNTILTSPIFDFNNITSINHKKGEDKIHTEKLYDDIVSNEDRKARLKEIAEKLEKRNDI